jgi:hypothetical protein
MKYAVFNTTHNTLEWYDTLAFVYPNLPKEGLIEVPDDIWEDHFQNIYKYENGQFVKADTRTDLEKLVEVITASLTQSCNDQILGGFLCVIFGDTYLYPNKANDQLNLSTASIYAMQADANWSIKLWCKKDDWEFKEHNADQVKLVAKTSRDAVSACQQHLIDLKNDLNNAKSIDEANAVIWTNPDPHIFP